MSWESEENNAYSFLNDLNLPNVLFEYFGKSNSTVPDIKVSKNNTFVFYMDIKMGNAQSSQFVVETINNEFKFSSKSKKDSNKYSLQIIDFLNKNFGIFNDVNSAGNQIKCTEDIKVGHIISDFRSKNIRYLVTRGKDSTFKIIEIKRLEEFFKIEGIFRRKKSGSSPVSKKLFHEVQNHLKNNFNATDIKYMDGKKLLFKSNDTNLLGEYFYVDENKYHVAKKRHNGFYQVTKCGKTNNPTVIFTLEFLNLKIDDDKNKFLSELKT